MISFRTSTSSVFTVVLITALFVIPLYALVLSVFISAVQARDSAAWIFGFVTIIATIGAGVSLGGVYRQIRCFNRPFLLLNQEGIHVFPSREMVLPWSEVISADVQWIGRAQLLMLGVRHPELYVGRFSRRFDARFTVNLFLLNGSARDLLEAIRSYPLYAGKDGARAGFSP